MLLEEGAITTSWNVSEARVGARRGAVQPGSEGERRRIAERSVWRKLALHGSRGIRRGRRVAEREPVVHGAQAEGFALFQNVPNPFKGATVIGFTLPEADDGDAESDGRIR
jgi:hypothetical protein